jgi:hypothetical protein
MNGIKQTILDYFVHEYNDIIYKQNKEGLMKYCFKYLHLIFSQGDQCWII